jgi:hypothetical protein
LNAIMAELNPTNILQTANVLYNKAYSAIHLEHYVYLNDTGPYKYKWLMYYSKIRNKFRNDLLLLYVLLYLYVFRTKIVVKVFI